MTVDIPESDVAGQTTGVGAHPQSRRRWRNRCAILISLFLCAGLAMADPTAEIDALLAADREFDAQTAEHGVDGWVSYFAEHGSMHLSSGGTVVGHEAIRELMAPFFDDASNSLRWQPESAEILIPGLLGYTRGSYESRSRGDDGETVAAHGTYVSLWKKQDDGIWKVVFDTGADDE
jgi:ketosteroid isomerase-like protein